MTDEKQTQEQADEEMINQGFQELLDSYLATKHRKKVEIITKAFNFAKQAHKGVKRRSGEPYIMHPIAVAKIVCTEIGLGSTSICSALLHDVVEDTDYTVEDIENLFGPKIAQIVDGLTKISGGIFGDRASAQAENFKKLLLTMSDDIRVILIKIAEKKELIFQTKQELNGADEKIAAAQKMAEQAQREHIELDNAANKLRTKQKHKMDEKETLSGQITRAEEQKKSVTAGFDKLVAQLWDDYELTRSDAAEIAEDIVDITVANRRLNELRGNIRNLGSVNLGAIEEYAEVSQRHEFLTGQLNDVNTSKTELEKLIDDLTENMKNMFTDSFERINANFKKIFTELFGGGQCELILTDPNNVLECGIEINVQPPGKVITNLMSLSGGEQALVAIAIYFAILKISPSPFCLLDEIEAALDDVNVSKYAQYLHHLTDKTQFITITHRRGTMEEADVLYGVTMQEKGVSKLLKMDVSETRQMKLE